MTAPGGTAEALPQLGSPAPHVRRRSSGGSAVMRRVSSLGSYKGSPVKISRFYGGAVHRLSDNTLLGSSVSQTAPLGKEAFKKAAKDVTDGCRLRSPLDANWLVDATISDVANFHFSWSIGDDLVFIVGVDKTYPDTVGQQALQEFKRQFADASKGRKADIKKLVKTIVVALSDIYDNPDAVDAGDVGFKQLELATPTSAMTVADVEPATPVSLDAATPKILAHLQPQARPSPLPDTATQPRKQQYQQEQLKGSIATQQQQQQQPRRDVTTILPPPPQQQQQQQQRRGVSSHDRQHARPTLPPTTPPPPPPPPPPQQLEDMMRTVQLAPPDSKLPAEATTQQAAQEFRVNVNEVQRRAASQRYKYATILLSGIGTFILGLSLPVIVYYVKGDLHLPVQA